MKIHEYQAKELFNQFGIPTTTDTVVTSTDEAVRVAESMDMPVVLKAQVHVGGRGKAGGIKVAHSLDETALAADEIFSLTIKGFQVKKLAITPAIAFRSESYLGLLIDRGISRVAFIGCAEGGVEIEETIKTCPGKIRRLEMSAGQLAQLTINQCIPFAEQLFGNEYAQSLAHLMVSISNLFIARDCSLIEINPLVVDNIGNLIALDGKIIFDDNALFRHPENIELRDPDSEDEDETIALDNNTNFVRLDGTIGCMVNGAGLAMATMDIIKYYGGSPANFLDAGGSSNSNKVLTGLSLIAKDPNVKVILINIFGGITRCDDIARGILTAREKFNITIPIVIRMAGNNEKEGRALIAGTDMIVANTLEEGVQQAVKLGERL